MRKCATYMATIALLFMLSSCTANTADDGRVLIRIAYLPLTHSAAIMLLPEITQDDENYRIELVRFTTWIEVTEALRARQVEGASILFEVALRDREQDDSLTLVSLSHRDGNVIVVDNTITNYQDLIGRTVAIPHRLSPHYTLLQMVLEREGIDISEINVIDLSPTEMPFAMATRAISAFVVAEPWGTIAEVRGVGRILETSNEILPGSICCVLVFHEAVLNAHYGLRDWLLDHFAIAASYAQLYPEKIEAVFKRHTSFAEGIISKSLENTNFENLCLCQDEYEYFTEIIRRTGVQHVFPDFDDFVRR